MRTTLRILLIVAMAAPAVGCIDATVPRLPDAGDDQDGDTAQGSKTGYEAPVVPAPPTSGTEPAGFGDES